MPLSLACSAFPANLLIIEPISNAVVIVAALRFGREEVAVNIRRDVEIFIVPSAAQSHLQHPLLAKVANPGQGRRIQFESFQTLPRLSFWQSCVKHLR
jgi:hypothetical protein